MTSDKPIGTAKHTIKEGQAITIQILSDGTYYSDDIDFEICQTCGGTREISSVEGVYPGEPHTADVGTQPCPDCKPLPTNDETDE